LADPGFDKPFAPVEVATKDENGRPKGVARGEAGTGWSDDSGWNWADVTYAADSAGRHGRAQRIEIRTPSEAGKSAFVQTAYWSTLKTRPGTPSMRGSAPPSRSP
jgi:hypothetical protein